MKKELIHEKVEYSETIEICPDCLVECEQGSNDIDSFYICPRCKKDDFQGDIRTKGAVKESVTRIYIFK